MSDLVTWERLRSRDPDVTAPIRLACVAVEPVFYQVPLYRRLAADPRIDLTVIFASDTGVRPYDAGFGTEPVQWDLDLLAGYDSEFVRNVERNNRRGSFWSLRDLDVAHRIRRGNFDAIWIHGYSFLTFWFAIAAAAASRRPLLVREEQTLLEQRPRVRAALRGLVLRTLFRRAYALAIGSANRDFFSHFGVELSRIFNVPYCVDNESLQARASELATHRNELRTRFGIDRAGGPVVLFVGKLTPKKRPADLVEAFRQVREQYECSLLLAGEGPLRQGLVEQASDIPNVHFAGFLNRSEIGEAFAAADLLVLPSGLHETWGLVVNEAMNFGLPVIASHKVGCARDLVVPGETGQVFPAGDVEALSSAIARFVADESHRRACGERARAHVRAWSYEAAAAGIVAACSAACGRPESNG